MFLGNLPNNAVQIYQKSKVDLKKSPTEAGLKVFTYGISYFDKLRTSLFVIRLKIGIHDNISGISRKFQQIVIRLKIRIHDIVSLLASNIQLNKDKYRDKKCSFPV